MSPSAYRSQVPTIQKSVIPSISPSISVTAVPTFETAHLGSDSPFRSTFVSATPSDIGFSVGQGINACSYEQCATSAPYSYHTQDDYTKSDAGFFIAGNKMPIFPSPAITYIWNINNTLCQVELTNMVYQTSNDRGVVQFDFSVFPVQDCSVQSVEVAYGNRMANIYSYTEQDIGVNEASCGLRSVYCAAITSINFVFNQGKSYISTYQQNPRVG